MGLPIGIRQGRNLSVEAERTARSALESADQRTGPDAARQSLEDLRLAAGEFAKAAEHAKSSERAHEMSELAADVNRRIEVRTSLETAVGGASRRFDEALQHGIAQGRSVRSMLIGHEKVPAGLKGLGRTQQQG